MFNGFSFSCTFSLDQLSARTHRLGCKDGSIDLYRKWCCHNLKLFVKLINYLFLFSLCMKYRIHLLILHARLHVPAYHRLPILYAAWWWWWCCTNHHPSYEPHTSIDIPSVEKGNKIIRFAKNIPQFILLNLWLIKYTHKRMHTYTHEYIHVT